MSRTETEGVANAVTALRIPASVAAAVPKASASITDVFGGLEFGGGRQGGGPVQASRFYQAGEDGPEWFVPGSPGTIVPGGAMRPVIVNNVFQITTPDADSFMRSRGEIENTMVLALQRAMRNI